MSLSRLSAVLVAIFVLLSGMQASAWHGRPAVEWHPAWWHFRTWAELGVFIGFPAGLLAATFSTIFGIKSEHAYHVVLEVSDIIYAVIVYFIVHFIIRWLIRQFRGDARQI
jgi:hypothetical protein